MKVRFCFIFINSQLKQLECRDDYCMSVFRLRVSLFWVSFFFVVVTRRRCCFGWWSTCDVCDVMRFKSSYGTLHKIYSFFVFLIFFVAFALCGAPSEHNVWKTVACCFSPKKDIQNSGAASSIESFFSAGDNVLKWAVCEKSGGGEFKTFAICRLALSLCHLALFSRFASRRGYSHVSKKQNLEKKFLMRFHVICRPHAEKSWVRGDEW